MKKSSYQKITMERVPIVVSQTLSKNTTLTKDIKENNLKDCFYREHWDIKSLLRVLKDYVRRDLEKPFTHRTTRQLTTLFKACEDWTEDEFEVIKEE